MQIPTTQENNLPDNDMIYLAVDASPNGMIMTDAEGCMLLVNSAVETMFGYQRDELIGKSVELLVPAQNRHLHVQLRKTYSANSEIREMGQGREVCGAHKNGCEIPLEVRLNPVKTNRGTFILAAIVDISERKHAEEMMHLAVEASPNGMVVMGAEGKILLVNSTTEKMFGYARAELIGQTIEILVPDRFRRNHPTLRAHYMANATTRARGSGRDLFGLNRDGNEFPVEIDLNPIDTPQGQLVLASIVDITERKRSEEMMRLAVEASPSGMILTDKDGKIVSVNSTAETIFGYNRNELVDQSITLLVPHRYKAQHPAMRQSYYDNPAARAKGRGRDLFGLHKSGEEIPVEIGLNPIQTNQGIMILASIVDITERKVNESKILDALQEKGILLAEVHHRVKNNLQIIDSLLGMQSEKLLDQTALGIFVECQNRVRSMALIHQTLYQSKDFSHVDFRTVVENLAENLLNSYRAHTSRIELSIAAETLLLPINTSIPLALIINELCTNILKHAYGDNEPGVMEIIFCRTPENKIRLDVCDYGKGIPPEKDLENDTSMGLMLVRLLCEQLNGELSINRKNPTRFAIEFTI